MIKLLKLYKMFFIKKNLFFFKSMNNLERKLGKKKFNFIVHDLHEDLLIIFNELEYLDDSFLLKKRVYLLRT